MRIRVTIVHASSTGTRSARSDRCPTTGRSFVGHGHPRDRARLLVRRLLVCSQTLIELRCQAIVRTLCRLPVRPLVGQGKSPRRRGRVYHRSTRPSAHSTPIRSGRTPLTRSGTVDGMGWDRSAPVLPRRFNGAGDPQGRPPSGCNVLDDPPVATANHSSEQ